MFKKAYTRTEILKFLDNYRENNKNELTVDKIFELLPEIYKKLKNNPENPLGNHITYEKFVEIANIGLENAKHMSIFDQLRGNFTI